MRIYEHQDYYITEAQANGGKAGKGNNKTTSIQVRQQMQGGYLVLASYNYPIGDTAKRDKAIEKAKAYIHDWTD